MEPTKPPILRACEVVGSQAEMARRLKVKAPTVNEWVKDGRPVPWARCLQIERITRELGQPVTCEELNPTIDWAAIRDQLAQPLV